MGCGSSLLCMPVKSVSDRAGVHVKAWFAPLDENDKGGNLALR